MRAVVTRVSSASVSIGGTVEGAIEQGFLVLLGVGPGDTEAVCDKLAEKICNLRVFEDENGRMNLSLEQVGGALLVGVNRKAGADFTFIMALPVMVVACLYELLKNISALTGGDLAVLAIGFVTAFVVGYFSIVWFMKFLQRSTLTAFGIYRILLALVTVWYFYM